jgi:hypothetical protein
VTLGPLAFLQDPQVAQLIVIGSALLVGAVAVARLSQWLRRR